MDISPSVYEHAAALINKTPWEASRDADLVFEGHAEAYRVYRHTPIMPGIDIYNLEPEAYGGPVEPQEGSGIPAIEKHILGSTADLLELPPLDPTKDGRIPMLIDVARRLASEFPEADIRVPVSGPFSIASNLVGFETLILESAMQPEMAAKGLMHLVEGQLAFAQGIANAGVDVAFFESAACPPLLSPKLFRAVEFPALTSLMKGIGEIVGHPIPCIIGGDTTPILDDMLETGTGYLVAPFETNQEAFIEKIRSRPDVRLRVNCDLRIIAGGTKDEIRKEADRVIELIGDHPNACLGTGALPYETPVENVLYIMEYVRGLDA